MQQSSCLLGQCLRDVHPNLPLTGFIQNNYGDMPFFFVLSQCAKNKSYKAHVDVQWESMYHAM